MVTFVPIASVRQALEYLISIDTINHLATVWSEEIGEQFRWTPELIHENASQLTGALRSSLQRLSKVSEYRPLIQDEFYELLNKSSAKHGGCGFSPAWSF